MLDTPFEIGQEYWMPLSTPREVTVPCPICAGQRHVTVILGDGEHVSVDCDGCGSGFAGPKGTITEWDQTPGAVSFVIGYVESLYSNRWTLKSRDGKTSDFADLCTTEAEAVACSMKRCADQQEHNLMQGRHRRRGLSKAAWTIRYHRQCIRDLERQLVWHRAKVGILHQSDCAVHNEPALPADVCDCAT